MIVVTLIPYWRRSSMMACVNPTSPNLLALYAEPLAKKLVPARLAIVMIYPLDCFNAAMPAFTLLNTPVRFVSIVSFQSASDRSSIEAK